MVTYMSCIAKSLTWWRRLHGMPCMQTGKPNSLCTICLTTKKMRLWCARDKGFVKTVHAAAAGVPATVQPVCEPRDSSMPADCTEFRLCQTLAAIVSGPTPAAARWTLGAVCFLLRELEQRWVSMPPEDQLTSGQSEHGSCAICLLSF